MYNSIRRMLVMQCEYTNKWISNTQITKALPRNNFEVALIY